LRFNKNEIYRKIVLNLPHILIPTAIMQLNKEGTKHTPEVVWNTETDTQVIKGISIPIDAFGFYSELISFLDTNHSSFNKDIVFEFHLQYFNTASSKSIFTLVKKITELSKSLNYNWKIVWKYEDDDDFMIETGENFEEILDCKFEMVKVG
jgi:hypothetical protein